VRGLDGRKGPVQSIIGTGPLEYRNVYPELLDQAIIQGDIDDREAVWGKSYLTDEDVERLLTKVASVGAVKGEAHGI
jgi:hypothetical protein